MAVESRDIRIAKTTEFTGKVVIKYRYPDVDYAAYARDLSTYTADIPRLTSFQQYDSVSSDVGKFLLFYDVDVINSYNGWRVGNGQADAITCFKLTIKDSYIYRTTLKYNVPELEDYIRALAICARPVSVLSAMPTKMNTATDTKMIDASHLKPRDLTSFSYLNPSFSVRVMKSSNISYIERPTSHCPVSYDSSSEFTSNTLPITYDEATLYAIGEAAFENLHIGLDEAFKTVERIQIGNVAYLIKYRTSEALNKVEGVRGFRMEKLDIYRYNRSIYCINRKMMMRAKMVIDSTMQITMYGDSPSKAMRDFSQSLNISMTTLSTINDMINNIDVQNCAQIAQVIASVYTNPNIYVVSFTEMGAILDPKLDVVIGILIAQTLFLSCVIDVSARLFCNNYVAVFFIRYCITARNSIPSHILDISNISDWAETEDRIFTLWKIRRNLPANVNTFLEQYLQGIDPVERINLPPSSVDLPWASAMMEDKVININIVSEVAPGKNNIESISPIAPYLYPVLANFDGKGLRMILNTVLACIDRSKIATTGLRSGAPDKIIAYLAVRTSKLRNFFDIIRSRLMLVAYMPMSDYKIRKTASTNKHNRIMLVLGLASMHAPLVYLSQTHFRLTYYFLNY